MMTNFDTKMKGWVEEWSVIPSILRDISFILKIILPKFEKLTIY